jgi:hypothetical protein
MDRIKSFPVNSGSEFRRQEAEVLAERIGDIGGIASGSGFCESANDILLLTLQLLKSCLRYSVFCLLSPVFILSRPALLSSKVQNDISLGDAADQAFGVQIVNHG